MSETYNLYEYKFKDGYVKFYAKKLESGQLSLIPGSIKIKLNDKKYIDFSDFHHIYQKNFNVYTQIYYEHKFYNFDRKGYAKFIEFINMLYRNFYGYNLYDVYIRKQSNPKGLKTVYDFYKNISLEYWDKKYLETFDLPLYELDDELLEKISYVDFNNAFDFSQLIDEPLNSDNNKKSVYRIWKGQGIPLYDVDLLTAIYLIILYLNKREDSEELIKNMKFTKKI